MKISEPLLKSADIPNARAQPAGTPAVALNPNGDIIAVGYRVTPQANLNNAILLSNYLTRHQQSGALTSDAAAALAGLIPPSDENLTAGLGLVGDLGGVLFHSVELQAAYKKGDKTGAVIASIQTGEKALAALNRLVPNHYISSAATIMDVASLALSALTQARKENQAATP